MLMFNRYFLMVVAATLISIPTTCANANADRGNSCRQNCAVLQLSKSTKINRFGNPIYKLTAYAKVNGQLVSKYTWNTVSGRSNTQQRNRFQSNTHAPLPDGRYQISSRIVRGTLPEVGGTMIPIYPQSGFDRRMRRTDLGIHWDPSYNVDRGEDGTSGCVGLTTRSDYSQFKTFVKKYHPQTLVVDIL
jgi:hypothetical protein